jgi:hypothetical protein
VYVERPNGSLRCRWVKAPSNGELSHLIQFLARRTGAVRRRRGVGYLFGRAHTLRAPGR